MDEKRKIYCSNYLSDDDEQHLNRIKPNFFIFDQGTIDYSVFYLEVSRLSNLVYQTTISIGYSKDYHPC